MQLGLTDTPLDFLLFFFFLCLYKGIFNSGEFFDIFKGFLKFGRNEIYAWVAWSFSLFFNFSGLQVAGSHESVKVLSSYISSLI